MKKVLSLLIIVLVLAMILVLVSCTGSGQTTTTTQKENLNNPPLDDHEHSYVVEVTNPTCIKKGYNTYTCECGDSYNDKYVDAKGHSFCSWEETKAPTCTDKGEEKRSCSCGHSETREIPANGHYYSCVVTKPTCTERGYNTYFCKCGDTYNDNYTDALDHDKISHKAQTPTCTKIGWEPYETCSRCDYTSYVELGITAHTPGDWIIDKDATYTSDGSKHKKCTGCGETLETSLIPMKTHSYKSIVTAPTCTEQGFTTHKCSDCGDTYVDDYTPVLGHNIGSWSQTKVPTCTAEGTKCRYCSRCDYYETRTVEKLAHTYKSAVTKPTCIDKGYTTHTCSCGDTYKDTYMDANGHKYGEWYTTVDPTCTETGTECRDCANCDDFETQIISATGHSYTSVVTAPTCIKQGYTTYTCDCGDSYDDNYVDKIAHIFGEWTTVKEATTTEEGLQERTCVCGEKETQKIDPIIIASEGLKYTLNYDGQSYSVTGIGTCTDTDIVIPSKHNGLPVARIDNYAFYNCTQLTEIIIPDSVTKIGSGAFGYCENLHSVSIGQSVSYIGNNAFSDCYSLQRISIPNGVTSIESSTFQDCSALTTVVLGDSIQSIGEGAFASCSNLSKITFPSALTNIGKYAFFECRNLTNLIIPDNVTKIGYGAFYDCSGLVSVTIGKKVNEIGDYAFYLCTYVEVVNRSNLPLKAGSWDYGCVAYRAMTISYGSSQLVKYGDYYFYTQNNYGIIDDTHYLVAYVGNDTHLVLPSSYNGEKYEISKRAFEDKDKIISITIPQCVDKIGFFAFFGCSSLTSIIFEDSTTWYRTLDETYWNAAQASKSEKMNVSNSIDNVDLMVTPENSNYYWFKK